MGKTRRIDRREYDDYGPRNNKYSRNKKKKSTKVDLSDEEAYFEFESDAERRWSEEYEDLNPQNED